jgi:hypothetical protein
MSTKNTDITSGPIHKSGRTSTIMCNNAAPQAFHGNVVDVFGTSHTNGINITAAEVQPSIHDANITAPMALSSTMAGT